MDGKQSRPWIRVATMPKKWTKHPFSRHP